MSYLKKRVWIFVALVVIAFLFWSSLSLQEEFDRAVNVLGRYIGSHQLLGVSVFVGLAGLSAMLSPFSSIPLVPAAVVIWGKLGTFFLLLSGWVLGGMATYAIGKYAAYPIFKGIVPFHKIDDYRKKISAESEFLLVFLFRLMSPAEIPGYLLGLIRYDFIKYLLATFFAELPFAVITVYASEAFVEQNAIIFIGLLALLTFIIGSAFYLFRKRLK
ncbi:MAG: VTT domain-containing protein [Candidatus Doudnabacteria bacterium]|nr:VTT domain-containing protein [Candidatus Doudnabacteria bacterium]